MSITSFNGPFSSIKAPKTASSRSTDCGGSFPEPKKLDSIGLLIFRIASFVGLNFSSDLDILQKYI